MKKVSIRIQRAFVISVLLVASQAVQGQYNESIRTGRPGQAIGAFTVGKNILQFQQGFDFGSFTNPLYTPFGLSSNNVVRFGILEAFEISALVDFQHDRRNYDNITYSESGLSNLHLGFRAHINRQNGWIPSTAVQLRLKMTCLSEEYRINYIAPVMVLVAGWGLPENMSITTNWILSYSGYDPVPTGKYVLNFAFPVYKNLSGFVENYGQVREDVFQTRFDGGLAYLVNNNFQLDISAGYGSNQGVQDYFVSTGISWRITSFRKTES